MDDSNNQSVFARTGFRVPIFLAKRVFHVEIELPQLQIGYQFLDDDSVIELAGRFGRVLYGIHAEDTPSWKKEPRIRRSLTGNEAGGHLGLISSKVDLSVNYSRILSSSSFGGFDTVSGVLCVGLPLWLEKHASLGLCGDGRYYHVAAPPTAFLPQAEACARWSHGNPAHNTEA